MRSTPTLNKDALHKDIPLETPLGSRSANSSPAMSSVAPMAEMADATVLAYRLSRWDHQLLQTHGVSTTAYASAKLAHDHLGRANTAATKAAREAVLLVEKRKLIAKLEELRAAAGQVMRNNPALLVQPSPHPVRLLKRPEPPCSRRPRARIGRCCGSWPSKASTSRTLVWSARCWVLQTTMQA